MKRVSLFIFIAASFSLAACDSDNNADAERFSVSLSGVDPLTNGFHYEGWLIINGAAVAAGKFNVTSTGTLVDLNGVTIAGGEFEVDADVAAATAYILTIEPAGDTNSTPSSTHYLSGDIGGGTASLSVGHGAALGNSFSTATGNYILATPTDGPDTNENSGVWFLDPTGAAPAAGLDLPTLPDGWAYEGWAVVGGTPVTSGTFLSVEGADDFDGFSSTMPAPLFPGEDYLVNAPTGMTFPFDIAGGKVVISIEPSPDDNSAPFTLKPLVGDVSSAALDHTLYGMDNKSSAFPTGTVTIK